MSIFSGQKVVLVKPAGSLREELLETRVDEHAPLILEGDG
jgi:hypothetical protein